MSKSALRSLAASACSSSPIRVCPSYFSRAAARRASRLAATAAYLRSLGYRV